MLKLLAAIVLVLISFLLGLFNQYILEMASGRASGKRIRRELRSIIDHHLASADALDGILKMDVPEQMSRLRKTHYYKAEFYAISIQDIGSVDEAIGRDILKFRLMMRNNGIHIDEAIDCWSTAPDQAELVKRLKGRMQATAIIAAAICEHITVYIKARARKLPKRDIWHDQTYRADVRRRVLDHWERRSAPMRSLGIQRESPPC